MRAISETPPRQATEYAKLFHVSDGPTQPLLPECLAVARGWPLQACRLRAASVWSERKTPEILVGPGGTMRSANQLDQPNFF